MRPACSRIVFRGSTPLNFSCGLKILNSLRMTAGARSLLSRLRSAALSAESGRATNTQYAPSTRARVAAKVTTTKTTASPSGDRLDVLEHVHPQRHSGSGHTLAALGPNTGGAETPDNPALRTDPGPLEHEDLLHGDDIAFHAGDLGDADHLTRAI